MSKHDGTGTGTGRNMMTQLQSARLISLVEQQYAGSGKTYAEFASHAAKSLGFAVSAHNVDGARRALGLQSEYMVRLQQLLAEKAAKREAREAARKAAQQQRDAPRAIDRIAALEAAVALLTRRVDRLIADLGADEPAAPNGKHAGLADRH